MNQTDAWFESKLGRWHVGRYPDMDTLTESLRFGGSDRDPSYFVLLFEGLDSVISAKDEVIAHMLCKNINLVGGGRFIESATYYKEVGAC